MNLKKTLALLAAFVAACVTPSFAQIFWNNQSPAGVTDGIWCVTYANGSFAAVTDQGNLLTSADGLTWSSQTIDHGVWLVSIAYGNGTWVVVGDNGTIMLSSDLKTWVSATAVTTNRLNGVLYNGAVWVAVGEADTIITSTDAIKWTVQAVPASLGISGFLHGITWDSGSLSGLATPGAFLITGSATGNDTPPYGNYDGGVILRLPVSGTSVGVVSETIPNSTASFPLEAVSYATVAPSGNTVAVGDDGLIVSGNYVATGESPTISTVPNVTYRGLANGNGYWVAAGAQGTLLSSTDGITWTQRFSGNSPSTLSTATLLSAAYSSTLQRFVVTGTGGTILASNSSPTVFANVSTRGLVSSSTNFIGGFVIEGTAPRTILIRADGPVLSTFDVPSPLADPVLTVYNSSGTVVATNTGWTTNTNPTTLSTAALEVGAFPLPSPSADSALLLTLPPGAYTAVITSAKGNSGTALFEAYTD